MTTSLATRLQRATAVALVASSVAAPAAIAVPDAPQQDRGTPVLQQDLRSPDSRDRETPVLQQDLRSPDARDRAGAISGPVDDTGHAQVATADRGFDWPTAGVAAAALAGLLVVASVGALRYGRKRVVV